MINTALKFSYNDVSKAEYKPALSKNRIDHMEELFCNFQSTYFTKYIKQNETYEFPFYTYGILDSFWKEQKGTPILKNLPTKNNLKIKWIYQLIQGLKQLHDENKYYGYLSSKCITIDDDLNVKYTYFDIPTSHYSLITSKHESSYYLSPEFFDGSNSIEKSTKEDIDDDDDDEPKEPKPTNNTDSEIEKNKKYDIYALGVIINGIVNEKFPNETEFPKNKEDIIKILKEQKKDGQQYPERDRKDPLWSELSAKIIDKCLESSPKNRPEMGKISTLFDTFLSDNKIDTFSFETYKEEPDPILVSCLKNINLVRIPSIITGSIKYQDVANTLSLLEKKYENMSTFFNTEIFIDNPFVININQYSFFVTLRHLFSGDIPTRIMLSTIVMNNEDYKLTSNNDFIRNDERVAKSPTINNFFVNNIPFCTLSQLIQYVHKFGKEQILNQNEIYSWILYLAKYLELLEEKENDQINLLPDNFSSDSVLVSLLAVSENQNQFQLSVFPYKAEESDLSKVFNNVDDDNADSIKHDIYAFGVLMFQVLGLYPTSGQQEKFNSKVMQDLFDKMKAVDPEFRYNVRQLEKATEFIEKCLTIGEQPSNFKEVLTALENLEINQNFDKSKCIEKYNYCLENQNMKLSRLAYIADLLQNDSINDLVLYFTKDEYKKDGGNPYVNLFNHFVRSFESDVKTNQKETKNPDEKEHKTGEQKVDEQDDDGQNFGEQREDEQSNDEKQADEQNNDEKQADEQNNDEKQADEQSNDEKQADEQNNGEKQADEQNNGVKQADKQNNGEKQADEQNNGEKQADEQNDGEKQADEQNNGVKQADKQNDGEKQADEQSNGEQQENKNSQENESLQTIKYNSLFEFLLDLMKIDNKKIINLDLHFESEEVPFIDFQLQRERLLRAEAEYDEKCNNLPPTNIDIQSLPISSVEFMLSTILRYMSQKIPHVLLITTSKPEDGEENDFNEYSEDYEEAEDDSYKVFFKFEGDNENNNEDANDAYEENNNDEFEDNNNDNNNENGYYEVEGDNENGYYEVEGDNENNNEDTNDAYEDNNNDEIEENSNDNNNEINDEGANDEVVDKSQKCTIEYLKKFFKERAKYFPCKMKWKQLNKYTLKVRVNRGYSPLFKGLRSLLDKAIDTSNGFAEFLKNDADRFDDNDYEYDDDSITINIPD